MNNNMNSNMNRNDLSYQQRQILEKRRQAYIKRKQRKRTFKRRFIKFLIFVVVFILAFTFYENGFSFNFKGFDFKGINFDFFKGKDKKATKNQNTNDLEGKVISYVPMDDRDIYTTRLIYLADSGGYDLQMPDSKAYKTHIDRGENSYNGFNTKYGNPLKTAQWLLEQEEAGCNYYIISLDQLFSGGLLGSEYLSDEDIDKYGEAMTKAKRAFEKIISKEENHVYLIDTVMGINETAGFMDITENDVELIKTYSSTPRIELTDKELTTKKIAEHYLLDTAGNSINTQLDSDKLNKYLAARERKITLSKYIVEKIKKSKNSNIKLYYGMENSSNASKTIQINDVAFLNKLFEENDLDITIEDGIATLPIEAFGRMITDAVSQNVTVKVAFFGDKNQVVTGSTKKYEEYITDLFKDMKVSICTTDKCDFEILVYTKTSDPKARENNSVALTNKYLKNIKARVPTVIVNDANYLEDQVLIDILSDYDEANVPIGYLIGYSNWNGYVHSSRIGLTQGITRLVYLTGTNKDSKCDKGNMKVLGEAYVEDMAFLTMKNKSMDNTKAIETRLIDFSKKLNKSLTNSNYISDLVSYQEKGVSAFNTYHHTFPWSRVSEISFDVSVTLGEKNKVSIPNSI